MGIEHDMLKTIIFVAEFRKFSQFFQIISFFSFFSSPKGKAFYDSSSKKWNFESDVLLEKEIILPPFCDLKFTKIDFKDFRKYVDTASFHHDEKQIDFPLTFLSTNQKHFDRRNIHYFILTEI